MADRSIEFLQILLDYFTVPSEEFTARYGEDFDVTGMIRSVYAAVQLEADLTEYEPEYEPGISGIEALEAPPTFSINLNDEACLVINF